MNDNLTSAGDPAATIKNTRSTTIGVLVLLMLIVVVINWPFQYTAAMRSGNVDSVVDLPMQASRLPVMAGWPYRFLISYPPPEPEGVAVRRFSVVALLYNLGLAAAVIAVVMIFVHRRNHRVVHGKIGKRSISIADLLALTIVLAAPFGWWQRLDVRYQREAELSRRIQREGGATLFAAWLPKPLAARAPNRLIAKLRKIRAARIEYPSEELVESLTSHRHLTALRLGGGDYDLRLLDRLPTRRHLHDLRISGRVIDGRTVQCIAASRRLNTLNLMRTNVSAEALDRLGELPLERLNVIHSDVRPDDLGSPGWSRTLRELVLGHPQPGDQASVVIEGWPNLEKLTINELESQTNSVAMKVRLADLPKLAKLELDVFQKFDLTMRNLPLLKEIDDLDYEWRTRIPRGGTAPGQLWCSRFDAQGLPEFEDLYIFGVDLEHFLMRDTPKFKFMGIGAFFRTVSAATYARQLTPEVASSMIAGIGDSDGPTLVDLDAVPLADVDFSPLAKNKRLTKIMLSQSNTNMDQWKSLEPMKWLKRLDVKNNPIQSDDVKWILNTFPELEHFAFSTVYSDNQSVFYSRGDFELEVVDRPNLKTIDFGEYATDFMSKVRIVNSPNLAIPLKLDHIRHLELTGASSIQGLSVNGPLSGNVTIAGLRDLQYFAVGGPMVNDELIRSLADCDRLRTLTLAYPQVTAEGLQQVGDLSGLTSLSLPGAAVDDGVIESWPKMPELTYLDLRDTEVTGKGVKRLIDGTRLTRLLLSGSKVAKADLTMLTQLEGLAELRVGGIGIDAGTLGGVLDNRELQQLDLSDSKVGPETLDVLITKGDRLRHLMLRNCDVDSRKLKELSVRYPQLQFELSGSTVSTDVMTQLLSARRLVDAQEWSERQRMQSMMTAMEQGGTFSEVEHPAIIDVSYFADFPDQYQPGAAAAINVPGGNVPLGTQIGRWFGGAMIGRDSPPTGTSEDAPQKNEEEVEVEEQP